MGESKMSFQERNVVVSMIVGLLFFIFFYTRIHVPLRDFGVEAIGGFAGQAKLTLWLIGMAIVANIVGIIVVEIAYAVATNSKSPSQTVDERDRHIEYLGDRFGNYLTGALFMLSLFGAAFGWTPAWVLLSMTYAFFFGSLLSGMIRIFQHRRGY
jgi:hypothetical protein